IAPARASAQASGAATAQAATAFRRDLAPEASPAGEPAGYAANAPQPEAPPPAGKAQKAAEARMKGYEGESCGECGNFTMVRNGTCLKCDTCGATSGCS